MYLVNPFWAAPPPGSSDLLEDPFDDSSFDTSKWVRRLNDPHIALTEATELTVDYDGTSGAIDMIDSVVQTYDVRGRTMQMYLLGYLPFGETWMLWQTADNAKVIGISITGLSPQWHYVNGLSGYSETLMEFVNTHAYSWCRMTHDIATDTCNFYLSGDGVTWTSSFGSISGVDAAMNLSSVKVNLQGALGTESTPRSFVYKNFRLF